MIKIVKRVAVLSLALVFISSHSFAQEEVTADIVAPGTQEAIDATTQAEAQAQADSVPVEADVDAPLVSEGTAVAPSDPAADTAVIASLPPPDVPIAPATPMEASIADQVMFMKPPMSANQMKSLFFSVWDHDLIVDARKGLNTRPADDVNDGVDETIAPTGPREISLGGIVYASSGDWTIWLNNMRISPGRMPTEIVDLKVYKTYIELEWFDASTNQIFPIRLRPHERFNIDARIFLPG